MEIMKHDHKLIDTFEYSMFAIELNFLLIKNQIEVLNF